MIRTVPSEWQAAILVCGKCTKKVGGGFGKKGRTSLAKLLRGLGNGKKGRKASLGVIETGCLKLCPKNAVVAINMAQPRRWLLMPPGLDLEEVEAELGVSRTAP